MEFVYSLSLSELAQTEDLDVVLLEGKLLVTFASLACEPSVSAASIGFASPEVIAGEAVGGLSASSAPAGSIVDVGQASFQVSASSSAGGFDPAFQAGGAASVYPSGGGLGSMDVSVIQPEI